MGFNWSGTIPVIGGIVQSLVDAHTSRQNTDRTNAANMEMARYSYSNDVAMMDKQNEYNRSMWDLNNQYNSPQAQMKRLADAGLNPHMVYGSGATATSGGPPARSEMAKYNAPTMQYNYRPGVDIGNTLNMFQDFRMKQAQIDNLRANEENVRARTLNEQLANVTNKERFEWDKYNAPYQSAILGGQARSAETKLHQEIARLALMNQEQQLNELKKSYSQKQLSQMDILKEKLSADTLYSQYRNQWMKLGITQGDPILMRLLSRMFSEAGIDIHSIFK